ncbi:hypothetical protein GCM10023165_54590 [Variovorax defluvii]|uniref:Uncharacterized protein n=1 Tax=Variovorax defluvii TaxID=913761 RepID=A0ABP8IHJ4_9BURK
MRRLLGGAALLRRDGIVLRQGVGGQARHREGRQRGEEMRAQAVLDAVCHGRMVVCTHAGPKGIQILTICYEFCAEALERATFIKRLTLEPSRKWRK